MKPQTPFDPTSLPLQGLSVPSIGIGTSFNSGFGSSKGTMYFINKSGVGMWVTFDDGQVGEVPAWWARPFTFTHKINQVWISKQVLLSNNPGPISVCSIECYEGNDADPQKLYSGPIPYQTNVGNKIAMTQSPNGYFDVTTFGAIGDGVFDSTAAIAAAITAAAANGGVVFFPPGVYISGPQTIQNDVQFLGLGYRASVIILKTGSNADLFSASVGSINLAAAFGTSPTGGVTRFSFKDLCLDGNKANQTSGPSYPLRFYGYSFLLQNVLFRNGFSGGSLYDWNGGNSAPDAVTGDNMDSFILSCKFHDNNGLNLQMGGPHDSMIANVSGYNSGSHGFHFAPNAANLLISQLHSFMQPLGVGAVAVLCEAPHCFFINPAIQDSDTHQLALLANGISVRGGRITCASLSATGIKIGQQAGETPLAGQILQSGGLTTAVSPNGYNIDTHLDSNEGTHGSIWWDNDGGGLVVADCFNVTGPYTSGNRNSSTEVDINGRGLTADGTLAKSGGLIVGSGSALRDGTVGLAKSSTVPTIVNASTITTLNTGMSRVTEAGAVTGIILQSGIFDGQQCYVANEGSFTVTFDVAGTSHVADGATSAIPALSGRLFVWDTTTSLWYRAA